MSTRRSTKPKRPVIGWREWVLLPDLICEPIAAKIDTGAVTSSIHAFDLDVVTQGEQTIARFGVAADRGPQPEIVRVDYPVEGFKNVRSSNGQAELRPVVRTTAVIAGHSFPIDITLASRDAMGFRMLVGRRAVRKRFVVDPGRSYLHAEAHEGGDRSA